MVLSKITFYTIALSTVFMVLAQFQSEDSLQMAEVKLAIKQSNKLYNEGFKSHNASLVTERYCSDGKIMAPNSPEIATAEGRMGFFEGGYAHGIRGVNFTTTAIYGLHGKLANEEGLYELFNGKGQTMEKGKYMVVWKKTQSGWKMYRDIFNSDGAPLK
jgi:ketosteroid isomerase-like protein